MKVPAASAVAAFEAAYVERARRELGSRLATAEAVVLDRLPLADGRPALAGWWCPEDAGDGLIVLPNPWDERAAIEPCVDYVSAIVDLLIAHGATVMEEAHDAAHAAVYWDVLLRPWLTFMAHVGLDRRMFCAAVTDLAPDLPVAIGTPPEVPPTMGEAVELVRRDAGNRSIGTYFAQRLDLPVTDAIQPLPAAPTQPPRSTPAGWALIALELMIQGTTAAVASMKTGRRVVLVGGGHLSAIDTLRLMRRVRGLRIIRGPGPQPGLRPESPVRDDIRRRFAAMETDDPCVADIAAFAARMLPRTVLEDYEAVVTASRRRYGAACVAIAGNYRAQDVEAEFLGRCAEAGLLRAFVQHGGTYLQAKVNAYESLEIRPWAAFMSWGGRGRSVRPLPSPRLARIRDSHVGSRRIVILEWLMPPDTYLSRIGTKPLANQGYAQHDLLAEFVRHADAFQNNLFLRRFPYVGLDAERDPVVAALPHRAPATRRSATRLMQSAGLCVLTYPDTPFIEAMVIGVPTVGLWDPDLWEFRDDARGPFDALRAAGVLFSDPRAAAAHVEAIHERASDWWASREIQDARQLFLDRFAIGGDWLAAWTFFLRELRDRPAAPR
ncbi:MAG: hypothetical protein WD844_10830 [Thermoleophilaceae bacterium]